MAIAQVASANGQANNGGDPVLNFGSCSSNDLILIACGIGDNDSVNQTMAMVTAGYTLVPGTELFADSTQDVNFAVFYKIADGSETTATFNGLGGTDAACAACCTIYSGVDTTTPFDVAATTATFTNTFSPDPPSIDYTTSSGVWVVIVGAASHTQNTTGFTAPSGYSGQSQLTLDTSNCSVFHMNNPTPADPEDPGVVTHDGTDSALFASCAVTIALRPAGAGGATADPFPFVGGGYYPSEG